MSQYTFLSISWILFRSVVLVLFWISRSSVVRNSFVPFTNDAIIADCYSKDEVYHLIYTVLIGAYFAFGTYTFRQTKGISVEENASSDLADLTLSFM